MSRARCANIAKKNGVCSMKVALIVRDRLDRTKQTSSNLSNCSSGGGNAGAFGMGGGDDTRAGAGRGEAIFSLSCDEVGSRGDEPGFGGSEGWSGVLGAETAGRAGTDGASTAGDSVAAGGGGGTVEVFDARAFASAMRSAVFSRFFFLISIRISSRCISLIKSFTSPGLNNISSAS
jgi:hypothetical protein